MERQEAGRYKEVEFNGGAKFILAGGRYYLMISDVMQLPEVQGMTDFQANTDSTFRPKRCFVRNIGSLR